MAAAAAAAASSYGVDLDTDYASNLSRMGSINNEQRLKIINDKINAYYSQQRALCVAKWACAVRRMKSEPEKMIRICLGDSPMNYHLLITGWIEFINIHPSTTTPNEIYELKKGIVNSKLIPLMFHFIQANKNQNDFSYAIKVLLLLIDSMRGDDTGFIRMFHQYGGIPLFTTIAMDSSEKHISNGIPQVKTILSSSLKAFLDAYKTPNLFIQLHIVVRCSSLL